MVIHGLWVVVVGLAIAAADLASTRWATSVHNEQLIEIKRLELEYKRYELDKKRDENVFKTVVSSRREGV